MKPREIQEKDYTRVVIGVTTWWLTDVRTNLDPELIESLCQAIIRGDGEVNVLRTVGETNINRFVVRHGLIDFPGEWPRVNVINRQGNFMPEYIKSLEEHLNFYLLR
jgi:hypothetical protein